MKFQKIFLVYKITSYEINHSSPNKAKRYNSLPETVRKKILKSHRNHVEFIEAFCDKLSKTSFKTYFLDETRIDEINPGENDLVISCGGDGMFLSCAQKFPRSFLLGVNSDYQPDNLQGSSGALTSVHKYNFSEAVDLLSEKKWKTGLWRRLTAKVNGETLKTSAVNEIFFGAKSTYLTCSARISIDNIKGSFLCSGIICCTGMGSHAWFNTAGGTPFSNELNAFGVSVLWPNKNYDNCKTSGIFSDRHSLNIRPNRDDYILAFDSKANVFTAAMDDEIEIFLDDKLPVKVVEFIN